MVDGRFVDDVQSCTRDDQEEVMRTQGLILIYIRANPNCNMQQILDDLNTPDVITYLAIHELVFNQLINGYSPYDVDHDYPSHTQYTYTSK